MIKALTLTDEERLKILQYWPDQEGDEPGTAFLLWQKEVLGNEIERRAAIVGQQVASSVVQEYVQETREKFPTLFVEAEVTDIQQ